MKKFVLILSAVLAMFLVSCGDGVTFAVEGSVEELGTQNMRVVYYANGMVNMQVVEVKDGKFEFKGKTDVPTMLEFYTANKSLLGRAYVMAGDGIKCRLFKNSPYKAEVKGNDVSQRWSGFLKENLTTIARGNSDDINQVVAKYVNANKNDVLSTILLLTEYDSSQNGVEATKLLSAIAPEARPQYLIESYEALLERSNGVKAREKLSITSYFSSADSLKTFVPRESSYSVLAFSNETSRKDDLLADSMRVLRKDFPKKRLQIVDISFDPDTLEWKRSIKPDSATWAQGWVAGAASARSIERLGVTRLPFYIVADSTGTQLYRGSSLIDATAIVRKQLK